MPRLCTRFSFALARYCGLALAALACAPATVAQAYEDQASIDVATGYFRTDTTGSLHGSGAELSLGGGWGLGDMFTLRASVGYATQLDRHGPHAIGRVRGEVAYQLDVLSVVPFFGVGVGSWLYSNGSNLMFAPSVHGLAGLDWLVTREWNLGLDLRIGLLRVDSDTSSVFEGQLRCSRLFDLM